MKKIGQMIYDVMVRRGIDQKKLCKGLCSESTFSRYLSGERHMGRLILCALLQRLGKSADRFSAMLTDSEYLYFEWRQRVSIALQEKNWDKISQLLDQAENEGDADPIKEQFYLMLAGITENKCHGDRKAALQFFYKALCITLEGFECGNLDGKLLCVQEINLLLFWQQQQADKGISERILQQLLHYVENHFEDEKEKDKLYSNVAAAYLPILFEKEDYVTCMSVAEKAILCMVHMSYAADLQSILFFYVKAGEALAVHSRIKRERKWLSVWKELLSEENIPQNAMWEPGEILMRTEMWREVNLLRETILFNRQRQGFSQEKLCESICEPESLSRIENGRSVPRQAVYQGLARRLSLPEERYYGTIETDDFEMLERCWKVDWAIAKAKWMIVEENLQVLESEIDLQCVKNKQYIEETKYILDKHKQVIPISERKERLLEILQLSMPNIRDMREIFEEAFWEIPFFSEREMSLLIQISDVLAQGNDRRSAVCLLERILDYYKRGKVCEEFYYHTMILVLARLSAFCSQNEDFEKGMKYAQAGIDMSFRCGNYALLSMLLNNQASAAEALGDEEKAMRLYRWALYCSEMLQTPTASIAKKSYETLSGKEENWYED